MRAGVTVMTATVLAALAVGSNAPAGEPALLAMFDTNHDGRVSLAEYQAYMDLGFKRLDTNGDGVLDASELPASSRRQAPLTHAAHRRHVAQQFRRQDRNHDGYLSLDELKAPPR
jgi:hypothetical protein